MRIDKYSSFLAPQQRGSEVCCTQCQWGSSWIEPQLPAHWHTVYWLPSSPYLTSSLSHCASRGHLPNKLLASKSLSQGPLLEESKWRRPQRNLIVYNASYLSKGQSSQLLPRPEFLPYPETLRSVRKYVKNIEIYEQFPLLSVSKNEFKITVKWCHSLSLRLGVEFGQLSRNWSHLCHPSSVFEWKSS